MPLIRSLVFFVLLLASPHPLWAGQFDPASNIERLDGAIKVYEELSKKDPWPVISKGEKIEPPVEKSLTQESSTQESTVQDERIPLIRKRLDAEGYIKKDSSNEADYDEKLVAAVKLYQVRNGLEPDGVIGKGTVAAMNVTAKQRLCQLKVNRRRFEQQLTGEIPSQYIRVNVPAFWLYYVKDYQPLLDSRVIAGRRDRKTPIFNDEITHLVVNPAWYVPRNIAVKDKLPTLQKDPEYLQKMGMKLYEKTPEGESMEVDPSTVDWSTVTAEDFNYRIVQKPGGGNALGTVKFLFPNKYDVYLHDTSDRYLFKRDSRSFSSGCVRVEKYMELAELVLRDTPEWDRQKIKKAIDSGIQRRIDLASSLPIHLVYVTAWVDEDGTVEFRDDIYRYDSSLAETACVPSP